MTRRRLLVAMAVLVAIGTLFALSRRNRDERIINRHLNQIREELSRKPGTGILNTAAVAHRITRHFTEDAVIDAGRPLGKIKGHTALTSAVGRIHRFVDQLDIRIKDRRIEQIHEDHARVYLLLEGIIHHQGERSREMRAFNLSLVKQDGDWLIQRAERRETIVRPE